MIQCKRKAPTFTAVNFEGLIAFGKASGAPLTKGMPWSFTFQGHPVTHEEDTRYRVGGFDFVPGEVLVLLTRDEIAICSEAEFAAEYDVVGA